MYAKNLRENNAKIGIQLQNIVDKAKNENNRGLTSAEREKFHNLETAYTDNEASIKMAEKSDTITSYLNGTGTNLVNEVGLERIRDEFRTSPQERRDKSPQDRAFSNYLRRGIEGVAADERTLIRQAQDLSINNTMSTTTGSQGGYIIPQGFSGQLEEAKKWFGGIEGTVGKFTTETGNPFPWPTVNDTANKGRIIGQNVQVTETDVTFGQVTFNAYIGCSDLVLIPLALVQDSYFDMDALTANLLGTRLGRLYNWKLTVGSGSSEPMGIVTAAVAAGNTYTMPTGETAAITYNDLVNIEHSVDPAYRYNPASAWMFSDAMLKLIKKLVDGNNRPLWQPGLSASFRDGAGVNFTGSKPTILDHPYIINQDMPVPAANANSILFGDMSTFKVREIVGGTSVLRLQERYADYLQLGFIAFQRFDGQLVNAGTNPIAVGIQSAT